MNKRIKELIAKSDNGIMRDGKLYPHIGSRSEEDWKRFAELIIEECAFQCQHLGDMERIGKHFEVDVFKQFGVE